MLFSFLGCKVVHSSESYTSSRVNEPSSRLIALAADVKFTRANRKASTIEQHKSAITDHVAQENHIIKWDEAKILDRDSYTFSRRIREAIEIHKKGAKAINRDEGSFALDHVYDSLLCITSHPRKENNNKFPGKSSEPRHL